ncbi:hypothetical protein HHI36_008539 [Cryptolaemus montrouzieri]|uniref:Uncharacterized protein n=1 Tax=Cryptolaemus montrouzieri TaxID=559131 RepID=A0ABD2MSS9_9CUCU
MKHEERKISEPHVIKVNIIKELTKESTSILDKSERTETDGTLSIREGISKIPSEPLVTLPRKKSTDSDISKKRPATVPSRTRNLSPVKSSTQLLKSSSNSMIACPVHFFRGIGCSDASRSKSVGTACKCPIDACSQISSSCIKDKENKKGKRPVCSTIESKVETNATCSYPDSFDNKTYFSKYCPTGKKTNKSVKLRNYTHDFTHPCYCPGSMKPRSAVIKCNIGCKPPFPKCDPVNLHKYYQRQWRVNRIPGENMPREQRFRWCFREKISCGPPVRLKKPLRKKYDIV